MNENIIKRRKKVFKTLCFIIPNGKEDDAIESPEKSVSYIEGAQKI